PGLLLISGFGVRVPGGSQIRIHMRNLPAKAPPDCAQEDRKVNSPHLIRLVPRDDLQALIAAFLDDLAVANRSPKTIQFYQGNLDRFHRWCVAHNVPLDPTTHTKATIREFLRYIQTNDSRW